jgi:hypothetical protein
MQTSLRTWSIAPTLSPSGNILSHTACYNNIYLIFLI